ncbi:DnaJ-domain-containing protein [Anaeromyces robustus]|uniref:DnaJ-domain-containing protein n=1 Tax=Anaeromyces robustus TaxID=1754192 RepID=A0A1Y1WPL2_9FUNG|nr:DnaJ-domain-containing protein [Anaeromyces robustus]|eukprot:ORX75315.1 DnaJ-domain-containing protein [Anaeromyces robustus]
MLKNIINRNVIRNFNTNQKINSNSIKIILNYNKEKIILYQRRKKYHTEGHTRKKYNDVQEELKQKLEVVPFTLLNSEAKEIYKKHHTGRLYSNFFLNFQKVEQRYIPFWVSSAIVNVTIVSCQVGYDYVAQVFNPITKRMEWQNLTEWQYIYELPLTFQKSYRGDMEIMQHYASKKYPLKYINKLRGDFVNNSVKWNDSFLYDNSKIEGNKRRKLDLFEVSPEDAVKLAWKEINSYEYLQAETFLREHYGADKVRFLKINCEPISLRISPIYVPIYVFKTNFINSDFHTFVNANNGKVSGVHHYAFEMVGLIAAGASLFYWFFTEPNFAHQIFKFSFLFKKLMLPTIFVSLLTLFFPFILKFYYQRQLYYEKLRAFAREQQQQQRQQQNGRQYTRRRWNYEWVKPLSEENRRQDYYEEQVRNKNYQQQQKQKTRKSFWSSWRDTYESAKNKTNTNTEYSSSTSSSTSNTSRVHDLTLYKILGVQPTATKEEIQKAFREKALKTHPDRFQKPEEKEKAKEKFQEIINAYTVLRDDKKKKHYDMTGEML